MSYLLLSLFSLLCLSLRLVVLLCGSLLVSLLYLALLQTLVDSLAASVEDNLYRVLSIIACWDSEVNAVRVSVGINDSKYWNTQTVCLADSDVLLLYVDDEEGRRKTCQVRYRTEVLLKCRTMA